MRAPTEKGRQKDILKNSDKRTECCVGQTKVTQTSGGFLRAVAINVCFITSGDT